MIRAGAACVSLFFPSPGSNVFSPSCSFLCMCMYVSLGVALHQPCLIRLNCFPSTHVINILYKPRSFSHLLPDYSSFQRGPLLMLHVYLLSADFLLRSALPRGSPALHSALFSALPLPSSEELKP